MTIIIITQIIGSVLTLSNKEVNPTTPTLIIVINIPKNKTIHLNSLLSVNMGIATGIKKNNVKIEVEVKIPGVNSPNGLGICSRRT